MNAVTCTITLALASVLGWAQAPPGAAAVEAGDNLKIIIIEGEDGVNIVKKKTAVRPIVEVRDKNNLPVAGVLVAFLLPTIGPRAVFPDGSNTMSVMTDANGRAVASAMKPVGNGAFRIQVKATFQNQTAHALISQHNFPTASAALQAGKTPGSSAQSGASTSASTGTSGSSAGSGASGAASGGAAGGAAGASAGAATAGAAAGGAGAAAGISTGAIGGIAAGGAAAAGLGAAYATGAIGGKDKKTCDSEANQFLSAANNFDQICSYNPNATYEQCRSAGQNVLDTLGAVCSCVGTSGMLNELRQTWQDLLALLGELGLDTTGYSRCGG